MSKCPNCHKVCRISYAFCPHCGYKLEESDVLYHYTSIETLNAILSNLKYKRENFLPDSLDFHKFCLRATHWSFFNDPLEYQLYYQKFQDFFDRDKKLSKHKQKFEDLVGLTSCFKGIPYIISLSKCQDNLDMWRSYSKNGTGVAIGFNSEALLNYISKMKDVKLRDCRYLEDKEIFSEIKQQYRTSFEMILSMKNIPASEIFTLLEKFAIYKHPCYINEREKRIITYYHDSRESKIKYRVSNGINIPYLDVEFPLSVIKEIVIGPCANKELNEDSIRMQLDYITGLTKDIQIKFSELPYRQV